MTPFGIATRRSTRLQARVQLGANSRKEWRPSEVCGIAASTFWVYSGHADDLPLSELPARSNQRKRTYHDRKTTLQFRAGCAWLLLRH